MFIDNVMYGMLISKSIYTPPILACQPLKNLDDVIVRLSPPKAEVAVIASEEEDLVAVHLVDQTPTRHLVTYHAKRPTLESFLESSELDLKYTLETDTYEYSCD